MKAEYVDSMGTDLSVVNAAKVSFDKASDWDWAYPEDDGEWDRLSLAGWRPTSTDCLEWSKLSENDTRLINYLARGCPEDEWEEFIGEARMADETWQVEEIVQKLMSMATHWTPFTHTAITLRMQAPVPIRTQCFKHKQGFTENEESRRYIKSTPELFVPDHFRAAADNVKQGSGGTHPVSDNWQRIYELRCNSAISTYMDMLAAGVCPEQARFVLPQGVEVNWIWTGNLASYARFYNQRTDSHAQKEVQDLAKSVGEIIEPLFPVSWKALTQ